MHYNSSIKKHKLHLTGTRNTFEKHLQKNFVDLPLVEFTNSPRTDMLHKLRCIVRRPVSKISEALNHYQLEL